MAFFGGIAEHLVKRFDFEADDEAFSRRRIYLILGMISFCFVITFAVGFFRVLSGHSAPLVLPVCLSLTCIVVLGYKIRSLSTITHGFCGILSLAVGGLVMLGGGTQVPAIYGFAVIVLLAAFGTGFRGGVFWFIATTLAVIAARLLELSGLPWPVEAVPERALPIAGFVIISFSILLIGLLYEFGRVDDEKIRNIKAEETRSLLRAIPDIVLGVSREGLVKSVLLSGSEFEGPFKVGDLIFDHLEDKEELRELLKSPVASEREMAFSTDDVMSVRVSPTSNGEAVVLMRNITESRKLRRQLAQSELNVAIERSDRMSSVGLLAAGMAHEINNPLTYLSFNIELIKEGLTEKGDSDLLAMIEDAVNATDRVKRIVTDLRGYSRDERSGRDESCELDDIVNSALKMVSHQLRHVASLNVESRSSPKVFVNEGRLVQVVLNLLLNASQSFGGGVTASNVIEVVVDTDPAGRALFQVIDNGRGISEENLGKIMTPFFTTKPAGIGTGLGLSVCKNIITQMRGVLEVSSVLGSGTTVTVKLPADETQPERPKPRNLDSEAGRHLSGRILCVDDEPMLLRVMTRVLDGHSLTLVGSAKEALEALEEGGDFDMIICDVMMPEMTGVEFYLTVEREHPQVLRKVVLMSGGIFHEGLTETIAALDLTVLKKPFSSKELNHFIADFLFEGKQH